MDIKALKDLFKRKSNKVDELSDLPLSFARMIRSEMRGLGKENRKKAIQVVRNWVEYVKEHNLQNVKDSFTIRFHLNEFAIREFGEPKEYTHFASVPIESISLNGKSFREILSDYTDPNILDDEEVAIYGGTARLALKIFAGVDVESELPINDLDLITNSKTPDAVAKKYKVDLAGTKIVDGNLEEAVRAIADNVDCSMNQVAIIDGNLLYTKQGLDDVKSRSIRLLGKNDPLFGSEGIPLPDGNVYLTRSGFYRTLSFLLRGKGEKVLVSSENIEREKGNIGRYWLVLLFVKLLKMKDKRKLDTAVSNWFFVAKAVGSTKALTPLDFLEELLVKYPEMSRYGKEDDFNENAQVRWLVSKLAGSAIDNLLVKGKHQELPDTYTPANIFLPRMYVDFDLTDFWKRVEEISKS